MSDLDSPLLDYKTLSALNEMFGEKLVLLIDQFIKHTDGLVAEIESAVDTGNSEDLYFKGQQFKGTSLQMGAKQIGMRCEELEALAEQEKMHHTPALLIKLKQEVIETNQALLSFKQGLST